MLDAVRLEPGADLAAVTAAQIRDATEQAHPGLIPARVQEPPRENAVASAYTETLPARDVHPARRISGRPPAMTWDASSPPARHTVAPPIARWEPNRGALDKRQAHTVQHCRSETGARVGGRILTETA